MGKRGPAKKPVALALLHGDRPSRVNDDAPDAPDGVAEAPPGLHPDVQAVWDYTVNQLEKMHLASPADRDTLVAYCEAVVGHRRASALVHKGGVLIKAATPGGGYIRNPALASQRDCATLIRVLAREFGLTPSARSELTTDSRGDAPAGAARLLS